MTIICQVVNTKHKFEFETQKDSNREEIIKEAEKYINFISNNEIIPFSFAYETIILNPQSSNECNKFDNNEEFYYRHRRLIAKQKNLF